MKKQFTIYFLNTIALLFISGNFAFGQRSLGTRYLDYGKLAHSSFGLEGSLNLLNLWQEQPEYIQEIYATAFHNLSVDPNASFADVAYPKLKTGKRMNFLKLCEENGITHSGGPMLGNISSNGVNVWLRTLKPANVEVRININGAEKIFGPVFTSEKTDMTAVVEVSGLDADSSYPYFVYIEGKPINIEAQPYITTTPQGNIPSQTRIAFGTCSHRWGLSNQILSEQIRSRKPMALLLGGDIAVQDRRNHAGLHRADYLLRDFQSAWKNLVSSVPVYATWDDHDYFDDDLWNIPESYTLENKEAVWRVFRDSWNNPSYGFGEEGKGVFFRTRIGPADVIMLDNRYFREKGSYLGDEQFEWLKAQLLECKGPFIILSNGTMWSDYVSNGKDSWGVFDPEGREELFSFIEENNLGGVLLISGDRHGARGFKIPRPSGYNFYEFGAASLGGWLGALPVQADWDTQLYGMAREYAFGEFSFNTQLPDPEVTFRLVHESGTIMYEITLKKSILTPASYSK